MRKEETAVYFLNVNFRKFQASGKFWSQCKQGITQYIEIKNILIELKCVYQNAGIYKQDKSR